MKIWHLAISEVSRFPRIGYPLPFSPGLAKIVQRLPSGIVVRLASIPCGTKLQFEDRVNLPIVYSSKMVLDKVLRIEQQLASHTHQKGVFVGSVDEWLHLLTCEIRMRKSHPGRKLRSL